MAHRLACDAASRFAGIVSLAGAVYKNETKCAASAPIAMLQVHGTADELVLYDGGSPYDVVGIPEAPGAIETTETWAVKNRCAGAPDTSAAAEDLDTSLAGAETTSQVHGGCEANGATELWTLADGAHSPAFGPAWPGVALDFLAAHPKP